MLSPCYRAGKQFRVFRELTHEANLQQVSGKAASNSKAMLLLPHRGTSLQLSTTGTAPLVMCRFPPNCTGNLFADVRFDFKTLYIKASVEGLWED